MNWRLEPFQKYIIPQLTAMGKKGINVHSTTFNCKRVHTLNTTVINNLKCYFQMRNKLLKHSMQRCNDTTNKKNYVHFDQFQNNIKSLQSFVIRIQSTASIIKKKKKREYFHPLNCKMEKLFLIFSAANIRIIKHNFILLMHSILMVFCHLNSKCKRKGLLKLKQQ